MFDFYIRHEYAFAVFQLTLAMLGMGARLAPADFRGVLAAPASFGLGLATQLLVVPCVAALFVFQLGGSPGLAVGLAICAAVPGGTIATIFTHLAGGHIALAIALTATVTAACVVTTPLVLELLVAPHLPAAVSMPAGRIAAEIGLTLLLPLALGMLVRRAAPGRAPVFSKWCIRGALLGVAFIVIGALGAGRLDLERLRWTDFAAMLAFIGALAAISHALPRLLRRPFADVVAINIGVTVRNTNLGLLIKASLFPAALGAADPVGDHVLLTILLYGGFMLAFSGAMIPLLRRK